jgi:hypothetical protein
MARLSIAGRLKVARYAASIARSASQSDKISWNKDALVSLLEQTFNRMVSLIEASGNVDAEDNGEASKEAMPAKSR